MNHAHHVTPGGPESVVARTSELTVKFSVGPMDNNCYLLRHTDGATVLIDAAADAGRITEVIGGAPDVVITTHRHHDHVGALAEVGADGVVERYAGTPDAEAIEQATGVAGLQRVWDGDVVTVGGISLEAVGLVGHTPGSIALVLTDPDLDTPVLFTGDALFPGGPGKTGSPADFASLLDDLETKLFDRFDDAAAVHPGHGDSTTLGAERPQLPQWRERGW